MVLTSSDASSDYDTFSDLTASQLAELDAVALSSSQRPIRKLPHVAVQLEEEHAEVVPDDGGVELRASLCSSMEEDLVEVIAGLLAPSKETTLQSSTQGPHGAVVGPPVSGLKATKADEADSISLFQQFRPRDFFSVSDLVGPLWCEVQYDYRLRSKSFLPPDQRPEVIKTAAGKTIKLNKVRVEGHEVIMRKGEAIHKALEREIHPATVPVPTHSREDVWGVRLLNMFAGLEALLSPRGVCRELPVVGFVRGVMVVGVIDEITRVPVMASQTDPPLTPIKSRATKRSASESTLTPSSARKSKGSVSKAKSAGKTEDASPRTQTSLTSFFSAKSVLESPSTASGSPSTNEHLRPPGARRDRKRSHKLYISDSKTRASGTMPRKENAEGGRMQLGLYKEMLDGMITAGLRDLDELDKQAELDECEVMAIPDPARQPQQPMVQSLLPMAASLPPPPSKTKAVPRPLDSFAFPDLFDHLMLSGSTAFSPSFLESSQAVVADNALQCGADKARCLDDMRDVWARYCGLLGLGAPAVSAADKANRDADGRTEDILSLVYRRTEAVDDAKGRRRKGRGGRKRNEPEQTRDDGPDLGINGMYEEVAIALAIEASLEERQVVASMDQMQEVPSVDPSMAVDDKEQETQQSDVTALEDPVGDDGEDEGLPMSLFPPGTSPKSQADTNQPVEAPDAPALEVEQVGAEADAASTKSTVSVAAADSSDTTSSPSVALSPATRHAKDPRVIGTYTFVHSPRLLAARLDVSLSFWMSKREPVGVNLDEVVRCGWCEFEEGCEWRAKKADEILLKLRQQRSLVGNK